MKHLRKYLSLVKDYLNYSKLVKNITLNNNEWAFLCPAGIGDTFILCALSKTFIEKRLGTFTVIVKNNHSSIPSMFSSISRIETVEKMPSTNLYNFFSVSRIDDKMKGRLLWGHPYCLISIAGYKGLGFVDMYKMYLGLEQTALLTKPSISENAVKKATDKFTKHNLPIGKTVILAPYAKSLKNFRIEVWAEIVKYIKYNGLVPVTNIANNEKPIPGTGGINISLEEIIPFCELAGHVISIRSGLCDLLSNAEIKFTVLYPKSFFIHETTLYEFYSLEKNGMTNSSKNVQEIEIDENAVDHNFIKQLINFHCIN